MEHTARHYAELQGAVICYCAQLSVKSPRQAERAPISFYPLVLSLHHSPHPQLSIQISISAPVSLGPGTSLEGAAGQLKASAGTWSGSFCRSALPFTRIILSCYLMCFLTQCVGINYKNKRKSLNDKICCIIRLFVHLSQPYFQILNQQFLLYTILYEVSSSIQMYGRPAIPDLLPMGMDPVVLNGSLLDLLFS